jgi:hypothetical protein
MRVVVTVAVLLMVYFPAALFLNKSPLPDSTILPRPFQRFENSNAYIFYPVIPGAIPDNKDNPEQSAALLYENEKILGPAHSVHMDVTVVGRGHYSFWQHSTTALIFSTSDNSDPNTNGRVYRLFDPNARDPFEAQRR